MADVPQRLSVTGKERLLLFTTVTTFAALAPTAYAAWVSNSVILRADFLRCLVEFLAIFSSWVIVRSVLTKDKSRFNYGFGKFEHLSGMLIGCAMLVTVAVMLFSSIRRMEHPEPVQNGWFGFVLAAFSVIGNVAVWFYNHIASPNRESPLLDAQRRLFKAKTYASAVVLVSLILSICGGTTMVALYADPFGSVILSGFILYSAIELVSASMRGLVDASLEEALQISILGMLVQYETEYLGLGEIRSRRAGGDVIIEISLEFDPNLPLAEVHARTERMKTALAEKIGKAEISIVPLPFARKP